MTYLQRLVERLSLLARPGVVFEAAGDELRLKIVTRRPPQADLIVFSAKPVEQAADLAQHDAAVIRGLSDFSELAAAMLDRQDLSDVVPVVFSQQLYNKGLVLNRNGLYDLFDFGMPYLESDPAVWRRA